MSLKINYCRLCLQKTEEPSKTLSRESKIFSLVTNLFPGMDTYLVINSKLCNECFKCVRFFNSIIEPIKRNKQKILSNLLNLEKSTCRLCLSNEKLDSAICLLKNTNEEARHIIEMAIIDLDFDIFRKPVVCNNCWPIVKSIYLFKKKCFATEKILKHYCATNKINSLDRKELEMVSFSYQEKLQQFSEKLDKQTFLCEKGAGSICTLNNFSKNGLDIFEKASEVVNHQSEEEHKIDIIEEKLWRFNESDENVDMAADTVKLESIDLIEQTEITLNASAILLNKTKNVENNCHFIKSPSQQSIDIKKRNHVHNNVLKKSPKKRKLMTQLSVRLEKLLFCDKCDYWTKNKTQLNRHCLRHDNNAELLNCPKCVYSTTRKRNLQNHIRNHQSLAKTQSPLKCKECPYETRREVNIEFHLNAHQSKEKIWKCPECYYITVCSNSLKNHMETHQTKPETLKCQKCDYVTRKHTNLKTHMLVHQDKYNFPCDKCIYRTKTKGQLVSHMLIHQDNFNFSCDKCNYQTKRKTDLTRHMFIHEENYNFKCHKCSYQARRKSQLTNHMLNHEKKYNFTCGKCNFQTKKKTYLASHMLIHEENYNFKCHKCSYQAKRKLSLVHHMLKHQNGKKGVCKAKKNV